MTARRQARANRSAGVTGVPPLLQNITSERWADPTEVEAEAAKYGVKPPEAGWSSLDWSRKVQRFRAEWCQAHDLANTHGRMNHDQARAAGLDTRGTARYRLTGEPWMH